MRILLINKYHFLKGGADKVYLDELALLREAGHEVHCFSMIDPRNLPVDGDEKFFVSAVDPGRPGNPWQAARAAGRMLYSRQSRRKLAALLDTHGPFDIAHLHNIYHQISPSILSLLKSRGIPVVMTLHDYKVVCGTYSLLNDGRLCERCTGGNYAAILKTRCNNGSLLRSALTYTEMTLHHKILDLYRHVDCFISPSQFLKDKITSMGFQGHTVVVPSIVVPYPIRLPQSPAPYASATPGRFLFTGRLSREKGVDLLLHAIARVPQASLRICGDGPERAALHSLSNLLGLESRVEFLGHLSREQISAELTSAAALVLPARWHENQPLSVIEAFVQARPVIGSDLGGLPELITQANAGMVCRGDDAAALAIVLQQFLALPEPEKAALGANGRIFAEAKFAPEKHLRALESLFTSLIKSAASAKSSPVND